MAFQFSTTARNNWLDSIETTIGTSPTVEIRTGSVPANCAAADSGSVLATITCPSDFLAAASSGSKALSGSWTVAASASGPPGHFRMKSSGGTVHVQGTVTVTGGGGDMTVSSATVSSGQTFTITSFTLTAGQA